MESVLTFRRDLVISRYDDQEEDVLVLKDPVSGKFFYLSSYEYQLLKAFDGNTSFDQALQQLEKDGYSYTKEDAQVILGKAAQMGLLLGTKYGTAQMQQQMKNGIDAAKKAQRFSSVYFLFIPLFNPDNFLEKTIPIVRHIVNKYTKALFLAAIPIAFYLLVSEWSSLHFEYLFFFNWENLLYLWVTLALTKLLHEFAHAYTAKSYGLRVPQMGVAFLIFFPCLYCNTTEAWQLADRKQRIAISAAGIAAEAVLTVLSIFIWYFTKPGIVNSVAFYLMTISFFSTVLFNANPLMRFDGYFILIDLIKMPNLYARSMSYIRYIFLGKGLGFARIANPANDSRESSIFLTYGLAAFAYRIFLYTSIVINVYFRFDKFIGFLLGLLAFVLFIVRPLIKGAKFLITNRAEVTIPKSRLVVGTALVCILPALLFIPLKSVTSYPCYIASAQSQKLTVPLYTAGNDIFVKDGTPVRAGQVLFTLDTTELQSIYLQKQFEGELLKQELHILSVDDQEKQWVSGKQIQLARLQDELARIRHDLEIAQGGIRSPFDGVVTRWDYKMQYGYKPGDGIVIGEVESTRNLIIHILIPDADLPNVKEGDSGTVWFRRGTGAEFEGRISEIRLYNEQDFRDSPFSSRMGGSIATEQKEDKGGDVPLESHYVGVIPESFINAPLGTTGKFFHSSSRRSIAGRVCDRIAQTLNRERLL